MSAYVNAGTGTARQPFRTDYPTPDADELRKRQLEERDAEDDIPADWEGGVW